MSERILDEIREVNKGDRLSQCGNPYQVQLPDFYGPMDLLLALIEREELEITKIALAQITQHYLHYVKTLQAITSDQLTSFLAVASKLILLKSQVLLPKPPPSLIEIEDTDETDDLVQQLRDYKRFKRLAQNLQQIEDIGQRSFLRLVSPPKLEPKLESRGHPAEAKVIDLLAATRQALTVKPEQPDVSTVISPHVVTIGEQINVIRTHLRTGEPMQFDTLLSEGYSRVEVIVTLLAVLELTKRRFIDVQQTENFKHITLVRLADENAISDAEWSELIQMREVS